MSGVHLKIDRIVIAFRGGTRASPQRAARISRSALDFLHEMLAGGDWPRSGNRTAGTLSTKPLRISPAPATDETLARAVAAAVYRSLQGGL